MRDITQFVEVYSPNSHAHALEKLRARSSRSSPCVGLTSLLHRLSSVPGVSARRLYATIHAVVPRHRPAALLFVAQDWFEATCLYAAYWRDVVVDRAGGGTRSTLVVAEAAWFALTRARLEYTRLELILLAARSLASLHREKWLNISFYCPNTNVETSTTIQIREIDSSSQEEAFLGLRQLRIMLRGSGIYLAQIMIINLCDPQSMSCLTPARAVEVAGMQERFRLRTTGTSNSHRVTISTLTRLSSPRQLFFQFFPSIFRF